MKDQLISFETAKLAKEKGFNLEWSGKPIYTEDKKLHPYMAHWLVKHTEFIPAPTQSLLQKWLREKHTIFVYPMNNIITKLFGWEIWDDKKEECLDYKPNSDDWDFNTYEEALEAGLIEALKLIK